MKTSRNFYLMYKNNPLNAMFVGTADMNRLREYDLSADNDKNTIPDLQISLLKSVQTLYARGCRRFICPIDEPFGLEAANVVLMARETGGETYRDIVLQAFSLTSEPHPELGPTARFLFDDILHSKECTVHPHEEDLSRVLEEKLPQCAYLICSGEKECAPLRSLIKRAEAAGIEIIYLD